MRLIIFCLLICISFFNCKKEVDTIAVQYVLETSAPTGDHFFVTYINNTGDTIVNHEHPGWQYSFNATKPFDAYVKAEVTPIDTYTFTLKLLVNGEIVKQESASTASGAQQVIILNYHAH